MSLRQNALVLAVLTALIAIIGAWSDVPQLAGLWRFPLALLLLGLAYERWMTNRAQPQFDLFSDARALLGRPTFVRIAMRHRLARSIPVELIADPPEGIEASRDVLSSEIPPGEGGVVDVRNLGGQHISGRLDALRDSSGRRRRRRRAHRRETSRRARMACGPRSNRRAARPRLVAAANAVRIQAVGRAGSLPRRA